MKKGILLAGGNGTRLKPATTCINKHLIPIIDKLIIDYPIQTLKDLGCKSITVVLGGEHFDQVVSYLKDGKDHGVIINYVYQGTARGIAEAINLCRPYVEDEESFCVCLGDNIFEKPISWNDKFNDNVPKIVLSEHSELTRFGVASINGNNKIVKIEEKPKEIDFNYKNYAITGCYRFNREFFNYFKDLKPSPRGEFEIVEIIKKYIQNNDLEYTIINHMWSDAGTFDSINTVRDLFRKK